jgi:hypothetical protein
MNTVLGVLPSEYRSNKMMSRKLMLGLNMFGCDFRPNSQPAILNSQKYTGLLKVRDT